MAYSLWKSKERPWNLVVLDRKTGRRLEPALRGCVTSYWRWSPDANWLALQDNPCNSGRCRLCLVSLPSGAVHCIDSLEVFADYEFGWSPNSQLLAIIRPEQIDRLTEEPSAADLWVFSDQGRKRCLLAATPEYVEREPKWVTDSTLIIERDGRGKESERLLLHIAGGKP